MISYPIAVGNLTTRVLEALPESGAVRTTVVFVHGLGSRADRFRYNLEPLAESGHRALAIDLPGHGFADKGRLPYGVPYYADFLRRALGVLEIADSVLVGSSLGGNVVARLALNNPGIARALVLVGSVGLLPLGPKLREAVSSSVAGARTPAGVERKLRRLFADPSLVTGNLLREELYFATAPGTEEAIDLLAAYFRDRVDEDVVGRELTALANPPPILLIWGAEDRSVPLPVGERAHAEIEASDLIVIPDAGHAPYYEQPDAFNLLLTRFITRIEKK